MADPLISPLRRADIIAPYTDAEQSLRDNANASPFKRSFLRTINTDAAGTHLQALAEARVRGDAAAEYEAAYNLRDSTKRLELPTVGPTRWSEASEDGNYGDYLANTLGNASGSMLRPLLGGVVGGLVGGPVGAAAGAYSGSYSTIRNAELADFENDAQLATMTPQQKLDLSRRSAALQAVPEAILPAYFAVGGRLPGALARTPVPVRIGGAMAGESGTEALQDYISQTQAQGVFPDRQYDWDRTKEAAIAGAVAGGAFGVLGRHQTAADERAPTDPNIPPEAAAPVDATPPGTPPVGAVPLGDGSVDVGGSGLFDTLNERFGDSVRAGAKKTKDYVSDTVDRMNEAAKTAQTPGDFLRQVFGNSSEDAAAVDLLPDTEDPSVMNAADPAEALLQRDAQRQERAAAFAAELLNDPATPDAVKERVLSFGGDFSNPEARAFVARNLVSQRAGEKLANAVSDLIGLSKDFGGRAAEVGSDLAAKARGMIDEGMTAAADRIVKKNLQDTTPTEQAAFNKLVFDSLTDEAKASPAVRQRLPELANAMLAFAARTGDLTKADLKTLSRMQDGLAMFQDPEALAAQLTEYAGIPRTEDSFLSRVKRVTNAQQDILKPNSFLYLSLSETAKDELTQPQLQQIARLVDDFTLSDQSKAQGDEVLAGLTAAFGSKESAQAVLDYYQQQNRADLRFDPNEGRDENAGDTYEGSQDIGEFGTLTERDAEEMDAGYRNPTPDQPFSRFFDRAALRKAVNAARAAGDANARRATLREYVDQTEGETPTAVATRIRNNLLRRLRDAENRDTDSVQKALKDLESIPQEQRNEDYDALVASLRSRKTENRTDLPRLRKEVEGMDRALGVTADELRNATPEQRAVLMERIAKNAPKLLDRYAVVMATKDNAKASDARIKAFRKVLDKKSDTRGDKVLEDWQARGKKTAIAFKMVGRSQLLRLSAESMVYESSVRGSVARRLAESIGDVLNRPDVEGLVTPSPDTIVKRVQGGTDITWGDIASEVVVRKNSPEQRAAIAKAIASQKAAAAKRAVADFENRNGLLKALRDVQAESLRSEIVGDIPEGATLKVLSRLAPEGAVARAKDASFEAALQWGGKLSSMAAKYRAAGKLSIPQKVEAAKVYSKLRVTEGYIEQQLDERFPLPEPGEFRERFSDADDAAGIYSPEGDYTADILEAEERIDVLNDRLEAVSDIPGVAYGIRARIERATEELDTLARGPDVFNRSRRIPGPRETAPKAKDALPPVNKGVADALRPVLGKYAEEGSRIAQLDDASYDAWRKQATRDTVAGKDAEKNYMLVAMLDRFVKLYDSDGVREDINKAKQSKSWAESTEGKVHAALDAIGTEEGEVKAKPKPSQGKVVKKSSVGAKSAVGGRPGRPGKDWGDKDAVKAEILRLRGKDVKVAVEKLVKQLGGSGQYTYDPVTGERLIEVAINARSTVGTARHEAMHDLFRFLSENDATRSIAKDLRDATSAPHVIRQLRDLLEGHKAALDQLNDPEERAAYAYQFWAEGLLKIGPTGTGFFGTIRQFIKDLFGIVTADQRGEDLLRAFHDGKFADPSVVQEVLQDINDRSGDRVANKLSRATPALARALDAVFSAAPNRLRRFENDHLNALADMFQPENGLGFVQKKFQQEAVWENRLGGILRGTTAVERREAIDQLQAMKPTSELAKKLAKFNDGIYEYMRDAGVQSWDSKTKAFVPLRKVQGYFTRSWDPDAIARDRAEFEVLLRAEGGVSMENAAALTENLVRGSEKRPKPKESPMDLGFTPYAPHTAERVLTFINPNNADKFAKFQRKDLADIMTSYVRGATHRAEYARAVGNNGEKIVELVTKSGIKDTKELEEISNAVQAMEGSLDPGNWSMQTKEAMSAVMTLQNVTLLPLALASQMIDPIVLAARTGDIKDAGSAYVTALKRLKNTIAKSENKVPGEELAEILGVVSEDSTLQAMAMSYGTTHMSKRMENINRVFFKYNGMQGWNNSMRIAATAAGEKYLIAHKGDSKALAELGLTSKDVKVDENGRLDVSSPKVQQAMFQFVDQAVLRPSASSRPVWMSDPRFLLVAHLKQFTFAMHNVVLKRANRELADGNPKPWGTLMLAMPVILAADMAKFALTGNAPSTWGFKDYLVHAVERSGLLGLGDFGVHATRGVESGGMPGEGLLGPSFEHLMEILRWIGGDARTDFGDVIDRTVPGARFV